MWIKTKNGYLVNSDHLDLIFYDSDADYTKGMAGEEYYKIADGNAIPQIITALRRGDHYMGVQ